MEILKKSNSSGYSDYGLKISRDTCKLSNLVLINLQSKLLLIKCKTLETTKQVNESVTGPAVPNVDRNYKVFGRLIAKKMDNIGYVYIVNFWYADVRKLEIATQVSSS